MYRIFNETPGIGRMSPDPLLVGGVWARDYHSSLLGESVIFLNDVLTPKTKIL